MPFEITVVSNTPLTPLKDMDDVALLFLSQIGYIPKGYDPKTDASSVRDSVPYRLFVECLLGRMDKGWTVEQLATKLKTTKATIYRHINKLKDMDLLDEVNVTAKKLKAIAVTGMKRSSVMPPVPTVNESGLPGYEAGTWYGVLAPRGTPGEITRRLNSEILKLLDLPDVRERFKTQGADAAGNTPEEFQKLLRTEIAKWTKLVKAARIEIQ